MSKIKKRRAKKKTPASLNNAPRNPYVNHPLMQKSGVHQKSQSARRAAARREVTKMTRDWSFLSIYSSISISLSLRFSVSV